MTIDQIFELLKANITETLPDVSHSSIDINGKLVDLGANSIDRMDITIMSMEKLDIKIPLIEFAKVSNIKELVDILFEYKNKQ